MIREPETYFPTDGFIVGDSAFPLSRHLMVPYAQSEAINNRSKRQFNAILSRSRVSIERAFGLLVARWRFLAFHIYILDQIDINDIISACCVLHNICIDRGEMQFEVNHNTPFMQENSVETDAVTEEAAERSRSNAGKIRRDQLLVSIFGQGAL
jgi:hypothetical protein